MIPTPQNHAPVTVAVFASAVAAVLIRFAKAKFGVDFAGMETELQTIAIGVAYYVSEAS